MPLMEYFNRKNSGEVGSRRALVPSPRSYLKVLVIEGTYNWYHDQAGGVGSILFKIWYYFFVVNIPIPFFQKIVFRIQEEVSDLKMIHYLFHRCSASWFFSKSFVQNPFPRSSCCVWYLFELRFTSHLQLQHHWQGRNHCYSLQFVHWLHCSSHSHLLPSRFLRLQWHLLHILGFLSLSSFTFTCCSAICTGGGSATRGWRRSCLSNLYRLSLL